MDIKAVLFDFDGTLADTLPLTFHAFKHVFHKYDNREVSTDEIISMFGPTEDEIIAKNFVNKDHVEEGIREYYEIYREGHESQLNSANEIENLLKHIKSKNIKMGVITGKSTKALHISLESLHFSHFFDILITGDDVQEAKPNPEGILTALTFLEVSKDEAVFIGDSNADIKAGKSAGLITYGVNWLSISQSSHFEMEPDFIFKQVDQFLHMIK